MIKAIYTLIIVVILTGCLSMPFLNPPCPSAQVFESNGYSDGYDKREKLLPLNSKYCKEENLASLSEIYNSAHERGKLYRCSNENIEKEYIKLGSNGGGFVTSRLNDCSSSNPEFNRLAKSSWTEGHNIYCSDQNLKNIFESQGGSGRVFNDTNFEICKKSKTKNALRYYNNGLKRFCALDNVYALGVQRGDSGESINSGQINKCEKFEASALSTYISGYNRGAQRLEQRRHREEQERISEQQLEAQRALVQEQIDAQAQNNSNNYGSNTMSCRVKNQSGTIDVSFCRRSSNNIRCYAEVEFENGSESKIMGGACVNSFSDCWSSGDYAVQTSCEN